MNSTRKQSQLEDELLDLVDHAEDFTRSDLQAVIQAFILKNCKE